MPLTSHSFRATPPSGFSSSPPRSDKKSCAPRRWGAQVTREGVVYSVWAPEQRNVRVGIRPPDASHERTITLVREPDGFHRGVDPHGAAGDAYLFEIDGRRLPDPASRAQSATVHDASLVVDPTAFRWNDTDWRRPDFRDLVIYELHLGTFTREGSFRAAIDKLPHLQSLGINAIEIMPIADFPGARSWGYDGVLLYAPARPYGSPDDLRALVDAAHRHGIAVILDVVYNHFGPDGNYLWAFCREFFNAARETPWGASINFDGKNCEPVRSFFVENVEYWMEEFHIDGFRLDATHTITDESPRHILAELAAAIHAQGGYAIAEDARNHAQMLEPAAQNGFEFDAVWADDFHHIVRVSQTRQRESYFEHYEGSFDELIEALRDGWYFHGQASIATATPRGTPARHLPPAQFLHCLSNHDQVGNRAFGQRLSEFLSPKAYRAFTLLLCLSPYTPMLFMGQEWSASTPFLFFTDHGPELGAAIAKGRRQEFAAFSEFRDPALLASIPDPQAEQTFLKSKLDWSELAHERHAQMLALHREALRLRRSEPAFRPKTREGWQVAQFSSGVLAIRYDRAEHSHLLLFNLSGPCEGKLAHESIAKAPKGQQWRVELSSEEERFGGSGRSNFETQEQCCRFEGIEAVLLRSVYDPR